jgi:hypothetical protein
VVGLPALPLTIPAQKYQIIKLTFTNSGGPADELVWGELGFATTHPEGPTKVALRARRTDTAKCEIVLNPVQLNYGTVPYGHEKTMTMNMINVGSAPCSWSHATVHDGAFGMCTAGPVSTSKNFEIVNPPPAIKDLIKPGMSWPLEIKYVPEADLFSSAFEDFFDFTGLVQVHVLDYAQPNGNSPYSEVTAPSAAAGQQAPCNLTGKSGVANVAAIPGDIDFGLTTVGCHSQTKTVTIYNTGKAPLSICDIALEACSPEFKLKEVPPIPACDANGGGILLTQSAPIEVQVVYAPQDTSTDGCSLVVGSNDLDTPALSIPLKGAGTYDDEQTDIFTQLSGQEVDVLFVVDNSGSMSDEQNSLANNFSSFINAAGVWSTDYRVAVVTTDMEEFNDMAGKFMGQPRFVQSGDISGFQGNVQVGDNGSGTEKGLLAAQTALALPLIGQVDPPQTCNTNDDCSSPAECVPSVLNAGQSFCGGWNMEFLRKDATLEVVFVSDEEDGSDASLSFYIDFLKSLKGFANENLMHAHAIVGDAGGCDGPGGSADDGARYREVALQTGGKFQSICDSNWAQKLEDIGTIAFGLKVQFFLSRPAIPDTITVTVAGQQCPGGWSYDPATNSILFDENHPCMPQEGQSIEVYYEVICYSE